MQLGDLHAAFDAVAAARAAGASRDVLDKLDKAYNISYDPDSLLSDVELRNLVVPESYCRDPMHVLVSGGVANVDFCLILRTLRRLRKLRFKDLRVWFGASWCLPKSRDKYDMAAILVTLASRPETKTKYLRPGLLKCWRHTHCYDGSLKLCSPTT